MPEPQVTFFLDVDNTLLDNDAAKTELQRRLEELLGPGESDRFWATYEAVRAETDVVNIPLTLHRFATGATQNRSAPALAERAALAGVFTCFPYADFLYPGALSAIDWMRQRGRVAILSDGDPAFQPRKVWRSGLADAVAGAVMVFDHKPDHLLEATAFYPARHFVVVDDKPDLLREVRRRLGAAVTTVHVAQGHYAASAGPDPTGIDLQIPVIGDLPARLDLANLPGVFDEGML